MTFPTTQQEAFAWFDTLEPVETGLLQGKWRGTEMPTGHPMDGMLAASGWWGKDISGTKSVHPLLFADLFHHVFSGNPGMLPLRAFMRATRFLVRVLFILVSPFIHTKKPRASLIGVNYRGKATTAMVYDQLPVMDIFAKIDDHMIVGVTELKWVADMGYFFLLSRVEG